MKKLPLLIVFTAFCGLFLATNVGQAQAQDFGSFGIATLITVKGGVQNGDIIVSTDQSYFRSSKAYDNRLFGVATLTPAMTFKPAGETTGIAVVTAGETRVRVTGTNGNIKKGEFITASTTTGAGIKASQNGYVIGQAMEDMSFNKPNDIKLLQIAVNIHFYEARPSVGTYFFQLFNLGQIAANQEPLKVFRYIVAAIILLIALGFASFIFTRTLRTGIEAMGRNPLASRTIQLSIVFNVILVIIIVGAGLGIIWLVLTL